MGKNSRFCFIFYIENKCDVTNNVSADQRRVPGDEGGGELQYEQHTPRANLTHSMQGLSEREMRAALLPFRARQQRFMAQRLWQRF